MVAGLLTLQTGCPSPTSEAKKETDKPKPTTTDTDKPKPHEGKFVSYKDDKLMAMVDGKEKDFDVKGVKPMIDGKEGKWEDLKKDDKITVTTKDDKVTKVEKK